MIFNLRSKKVLASRCEYFWNVFSQGLGLMFRSKDKNFCGVFVFDRLVRDSFHSFFMFFDLTLVFLNEKREVVEIKKCLKPFSVYFPKKKYRFALEFAKYVDVKIGDVLVV